MDKVPEVNPYSFKAKTGAERYVEDEILAKNNRTDMIKIEIQEKDIQLVAQYFDNLIFFKFFEEGSGLLNATAKLKCTIDLDKEMDGAGDGYAIALDHYISELSDVIIAGMAIGFHVTSPLEFCETLQEKLNKKLSKRYDENE